MLSHFWPVASLPGFCRFKALRSGSLVPVQTITSSMTCLCILCNTFPSTTELVKILNNICSMVSSTEHTSKYCQGYSNQDGFAFQVRTIHYIFCRTKHLEALIATHNSTQEGQWQEGEGTLVQNMWKVKGSLQQPKAHICSKLEWLGHLCRSTSHGTTYFCFNFQQIRGRGPLQTKPWAHSKALDVPGPPAGFWKVTEENRDALFRKGQETGDNYLPKHTQSMQREPIYSTMENFMTHEYLPILPLFSIILFYI